MKWSRVLTIGLTMLVLLFLLWIGDHYNRRSGAESTSYLTDSSVLQGKELAAIYCSACHLKPDPGLADRKSWINGILPAMGPRLGIFYYHGRDYPSSARDRFVGSNYYPSQPLLSTADWGHILDYYALISPDSLPGQNRPVPIHMGLPFFEARIPVFHTAAPITCLVAVDSNTRPRTLVVGDAASHNLFRFAPDMKLVDSLPTPGAVVDLLTGAQEMTICNIGILNPNNARLGSVRKIRRTAGGGLQLEKPLFDSLARPVQVTEVDLNQDGRPDYLLCEFGNLRGELCWMENLGKGKFQRHLLRAQPGAIKAWVQDYNHDGLPDLWVLFAQGDEGIFLFTNKGHGEFDQQEVLRFPPIFGSSYFELADFNQDGFPDILYTCGDNADFSQVLKPYHGVYIFLNDGKNHFHQRYFFPINGCYKAIARDFQGNGNLDIATISFFADYQRQPEEGFVYLENKGNFRFIPYSLPEAKLGRWLTMTAADLDGDGKTDLILGNFSLGPILNKSAINWKAGPEFLYLRNITGH